MRPLILVALAAACGTPPAPPQPELARDWDEVSAETKRALAEAERLYRADDPAFETVRDELALEPETAYWLTLLLVDELVAVWERAEANETRLLQPVLGEGNPAVDRALRHFDAMGTSTVESLMDVVVKSPKFETREVGVRLLARLGDAALLAVDEIARNSDPRTRRLASEVVVNMAEPVPGGAMEILRGMATDADFTVRAAAVKGLARGGQEEVGIVRRMMLEDPDDFVRRTAAGGLLEFPDPDVTTAEAYVRYLELCIRQGDRRGAEAADLALRRLAGRRQPADLATWKAWLRSVSGTVR